MLTRRFFALPAAVAFEAIGWVSPLPTAVIEYPGPSAFVSAAHVDDMRTRAGSGELDPAFSTDAHWVLDLAATWKLFESTELIAKVDNLLDEDYVASRRPSGVRPGKPQTVSLGVRLAF